MIITEIQTDERTNRQTFSKNSQIVFRTVQNVQFHKNLEIENFYENFAFYYLYRRELKKTGGGEGLLSVRKIFTYLYGIESKKRK